MQSLLWARNNLYIVGPLLLLAIFAGRELLFFKLKNYYTVYMIVLFPGVVIHEFSHLAACLLTGAKIRDVEFFSSGGGHVIHSKPKLKYIGTFIVSIFPLLTGITLVYFLSGTLTAATTGLVAVILKIVIFYLLTTIIITMFPSSKDFSNAYILYILLISLSLLSLYFFKRVIGFSDEIILFLLFCLIVLVIANLILYTLLGLNVKNKTFISKGRRL